MISIKLVEGLHEELNTNDLQWFQDAVLAAGGHDGTPHPISIMGGTIEVYIPSGETRSD